MIDIIAKFFLLRKETEIRGRCRRGTLFACTQHKKNLLLAYNVSEVTIVQNHQSIKGSAFDEIGNAYSPIQGVY